MIKNNLNNFTFNGKNSLDYGIAITSANPFNFPEREITKISIPGHDGDYIQSANRYKNVQISYNCTVIPQTNIFNSLSEQIDSIAEWLYSATDDYAILTDSYNLNTYRNARYDGGLQPTKNGLLYSFTVNFDCEPYKFLTTNNNIIKEITADNLDISLNNYNARGSVPLIKLTPHSTDVIGMSFSLNNINWFFAVNCTVTVDCKTGKVYTDDGFAFYHNGNANVFIPPTSPTMPILKCGINNLHIDSNIISNISKIEIIPRWYK